MPHFQVDDDLSFHAKTIAAGNAAMGLWVRAGSMCARQLTDGFVSAEIATALGSRAEANRLVSARLWEKVPGGYRFHEWDFDERTGLKRQITADQHLSERRRKAKATAEYRRRQAERKATAEAAAQQEPPDDPWESNVANIRHRKGK